MAFRGREIVGIPRPTQEKVIIGSIILANGIGRPEILPNRQVRYILVIARRGFQLYERVGLGFNPIDTPNPPWIFIDPQQRLYYSSRTGEVLDLPCDWSCFFNRGPIDFIDRGGFGGGCPGGCFGGQNGIFPQGGPLEDNFNLI